jgi:hypothetical protein
MAKQEEQEENVPQKGNSPIVGSTNTFTGGMVKDPVDLFKKSNTYTHARNMSTFLPDGQLGGRSSELANIPSALVPYTIIGSAFLGDGSWIIFSTNNTLSEIGIFSENSNSYSTLMNDAVTIVSINPITGTFYSGLGFKTTNLITAVARRGYDCGFDVYWSDGGLNPDRILNTATCPWTIGAFPTSPPKTVPNPWVQNCITTAACVDCYNTNKIDIEQLRLAPLLDVPCIKLSKSKSGGLLPNGSYQVCVAYAVNSIKCTDYLAFSDVYSTFTHLNNGGCIDVTIEGISDSTKIRFTELEVVVISMVNQQVQAKRLGIYSTNQGKITIDNIDLTLPNIPIEKLPISTPAIVSSDAIFGISNYLTRVGPKEYPDFNYQPLANKIETYWAAVEYPEDYYHVGGNDYGMNVSYLRGEVYAFFIRWIRNTGDKTASYHIPARSVPTPASNAIGLPGGPSVPGSISTVMYGRTGVYVSNEKYPDRSPAVWTVLCGQNIMHHRMPDQADAGGTWLSHFNPHGAPPTGTPGTISILGVYFDQIAYPVDINNNPVPGIVGYEILRASRDGHQSIIAKGMINNIRKVSDNQGNPQLFANYPYNDLGRDEFLTENFSNVVNGQAGNGFEVNDCVPEYNSNPAISGFDNNKWSFHSPDTVFKHPYLGKGTLEVVMGLNGQSTGLFQTPYRHPQFKVMTDFVGYLTFIAGATFIAIQAIQAITMGLGGDAPDIKMAATESLPISFPILANTSTTIAGSTAPGAISIAATGANIAILAALFPIQLSAFQQQLLNIIKGLVKPSQYALQYNSWGYYNKPVSQPRIPAAVNDYQYIKDQMQSFAGYTVNNLYRNDYVIMNTDQVIPPFPFGDIQSRFRIYNSSLDSDDQIKPNNWENRHIGSYYAAYKVPQLSQYGQIDSTKQVPIGCAQQIVYKAAPGTLPPSPVMFGGDTYINRYTEKNPFMFFNDWLVNAPDDFTYDYRNYINVPYPMFWINNDVLTYDFLGRVSRNRRLDGPLNLWILGGGGGLFSLKTGYFYLFNNGVRDFFVESSVNVGYRDWEDMTAKRFYDPYASANTFINEMFRSDIIKSNTLYKYDFSLSSNRFINQFISWGQCLRRDYDPMLAYTCFAYYPRRVAYSLPQEEEQMQDNWRIFLPNNYKDFNDRVYVIKDLHKTGAVFLMENSSPMMFAGIETIPSRSGTEYSVGTGALFNQTLQSINNIDDPYEYGSCQSRQGVVNTPHGVFWVSQDTGKIFNLKSGQLTDLGIMDNISYHLYHYLPSQLTQQVPSFPLKDNPVSGVGCQLVYDSSHEILYICKKDYGVRPNAANYYNGQWYVGPCPPGTAPAGTDPVTGKPICVACLDGTPCPGVKVTFGDPRYFDDASWTLSFDCVTKTFVSWHDWHPSHVIPSKIGFFTANGLSGRLWRHNFDNQSFANFYGVDYPVEIEYYTNTQVTETVLQSVEWLLESYQYAPNGTDKFLNYDENFDQVMIYNREQNSTLQNMFLKPWNDPYAALSYPNFSGPTRQVLYQKVENKYRLNDFYDYTKDRGQFFVTSNIPMITTDPNGYTFSTNTPYFDLSKPWNQLKRMRFMGTRIFMRKRNLGKNSLTIRYANTKNQYSPR